MVAAAVGGTQAVGLAAQLMAAAAVGWTQGEGVGLVLALGHHHVGMAAGLTS